MSIAKLVVVEFEAMADADGGFAIADGAIKLRTNTAVTVAAAPGVFERGVSIGILGYESGQECQGIAGFRDPNLWPAVTRRVVAVISMI